MTSDGTSWPTLWAANEIRALATVRRDTYASLGEHLGASGETVRRWATGDRRPATGAKALLRALDATLAALESWQRAWFDQLTTSNRVDQDAGWVAGDEQESSSTRRDQFLKLVGVFASVPLRLPPLERIVAALERRVPPDDRLVTAIEQLTGVLRASYAQASPHRLVRAARTHVSTVLDLLDEPMLPAQRQRLTVSAGEAAVLSGWLTHDLDHRLDARAFFDLAASLAGEAEDLSLQAKMLRCSSALHSAVLRGGQGGNPRRALALAEQANATCPDNAPAHARLQLAARQAIEHAANRQPQQCRRLMGCAERALEDTHDERASTGLWSDLSEVAGLCWLLLGHLDQAETELARALEQAVTVRPRVVVLADLTRVRTAQDRPELACRTLATSHVLATQGSYALGIQRIRGARAQFPTRWSDLPCVRELDERLRSLVR